MDRGDKPHLVCVGPLSFSSISKSRNSLILVFRVPNTALWSLILGPVWCYVLTQPEGPQLASQYKLSVLIICLSTLLDSMTEAPYIVGKYFLYYKLRVIPKLV